MRVTVIDYKAGNLTSVVKSLRHEGAEVTVTDEPGPLAAAERIVLPGVGHFAATKRLDETGLTPAIRDAIARGIPFLGICVGMQWLLEGSTEAPEQPGLGHFLGTCDRFPDGRYKVPHVGWNSIGVSLTCPRLLAYIRRVEFVYFTHSYFAPMTTEFQDADGEYYGAVVADTEYIHPFAAALEFRNVFATQFHPEKSGEAGLRILRNFLEVA
jgi:glutamine amidotransferase